MVNLRKRPDESQLSDIKIEKLEEEANKKKGLDNFWDKDDYLYNKDKKKGIELNDKIKAITDMIEKLQVNFKR